MAFGRNKGFTAKQSKRVARQMQDAHIGTHHVRRPTVHRGAYGGSVQRGSVYGERRQDERGVRYKGNRIQRRERGKGALLAVILVAAVVAAAIIVGLNVFYSSCSAKMSLEDENAKASLAKATSGEPYYALFVADLTPGDGDAGVDAALLARIDETNKTASLLSIPWNTQVYLSDGNYHALADACANGGDAELIAAVSGMANLGISHFMRVGAQGIAQLTDAVGGVPVTLTEPLDDPNAGSLYLAPGTYTLSGDQAPVYLKASNFTDGVAERGMNQCSFAAYMAQEVLAKGGVGFALQLDKHAAHLQTDWDAKGLIALNKAMRGLSADDVLKGVVPGYVSSRDTREFIANAADLAKVLAAFKAGSEPAIAKEQMEEIDPTGVSVTVKNGSGVTGEAAIVAEALTAKGFVVTETANADAYVYEETLIIYRDDAKEAAANAVQKALGYGRVIPSAGFYEFESDILVMYGGDRKVT